MRPMQLMLKPYTLFHQSIFSVLRRTEQKAEGRLALKPWQLGDTPPLASALRPALARPQTGAGSASDEARGCPERFGESCPLLQALAVRAWTRIAGGAQKGREGPMEQAGACTRVATPNQLHPPAAKCQY